ncbi:MAG: branched-chain amino acid ABC transporter permease [Thermodesulfobacteriota bacterium]
MLLQVVLNSLVLGLTYVLMASGLTLVFGIMRIVNFAHGQMYMLGAYGLYYAYNHLHINYFLSILISATLVGFFGILIERGVIRPFIKGPVVPILSMLLGFMILLEGVASLIFGDKDKAVQSPFAGKIIHMGPVTLSVERVVIIVTGILIILGLYYFIFRTKEGKAIRAMAQDRHAATLQGISVNRVSILVMGIGCALAAAAGSIIAPIFVVNPFIGHTPLFKALIVITLGGMGSIFGALLGGLILGFIEGFGYTYGGMATEMFGFFLLMVILLTRPRGFFGVAYEITH